MPVAILRTSVRASDPEQGKASTIGMEMFNPVRDAQRLCRVLTGIFNLESQDFFGAGFTPLPFFIDGPASCDVEPNAKSICCRLSRTSVSTMWPFPSHLNC